MKTAVSIPDPVFRSAERLAARMKVSRSELNAKALAEFIAEHGDDAMTMRLNEVYAADPDASRLDDALAGMQRRTLGGERW